MALSDPTGMLASPFVTIEYEEDDTAIKSIVDIVEQKQVGCIVVGLPLSMDGSHSSQAEKVKAFTGKLCSHIGIPVEFRDERLTTVSAKRLMRAAGNKGRNSDDAVAAAIILQAYLDEKV